MGRCLGPSEYWSQAGTVMYAMITDTGPKNKNGHIPASVSPHELRSASVCVAVDVSIFLFLLSRPCSRIATAGKSHSSRHPNRMTRNLGHSCRLCVSRWCR